jgi:hypothetical protein
MRRKIVKPKSTLDKRCLFTIILMNKYVDYGTKKANLTNHSSNVFLRNQSNIDFVNLRTLKVFRETKIKTMNLAMDR